MTISKNHINMNRQILVRLTEEDFQKVREQAKKRKMAMGTLIRSIFFSHFDELTK